MQKKHERYGLHQDHVCYLAQITAEQFRTWVPCILGAKQYEPRTRLNLEHVVALGIAKRLSTLFRRNKDEIAGYGPIILDYCSAYGPAELRTHKLICMHRSTEVFIEKASTTHPEEQDGFVIQLVQICDEIYRRLNEWPASVGHVQLLSVRRDPRGNSRP